MFFNDDGVDSLTDEVRRLQLDIKVKSLEEDLLKLTTELKKERDKPYDYDEAFQYLVKYGKLPEDFKHFPNCPQGLSPLLHQGQFTQCHHRNHSNEVEENILKQCQTDESDGLCSAKQRLDLASGEPYNNCQSKNCSGLRRCNNFQPSELPEMTPYPQTPTDHSSPPFDLDHDFIF